MKNVSKKLKIIPEGSLKLCLVCGSCYITKYKILKSKIIKIEGCIEPNCKLYNKEL